MNSSSRSPLLAIILLALIILAASGRPAVAQEGDSGADGPLFIPLAEPASAGAIVPAPEVIRSRTVAINAAAIRPSADQPPAQTITLNLFDDETWLARQTKVESNPSGSFTWIGTIDNKPQSSVIFVIRDGLLTGKVAVDDEVYTIDPTGAVTHAVLQVDPNIINPEEFDDGIIPPPELIGSDTGRPEADTQGVAVASDDGSIIDVMVVYTAAARTTAGSVAAIESRIELGISETNQAYEQSGVGQRVFLVHMEEIVYTESGDVSTDLGRLAALADTYMDNVHTLRNTYHADFVKLVVSAGGAGVAYLQSSISPTFSSSAFSVTQYSAISPNYTFAHELGHNMGLRHDWYMDNGVTPFTHAHGLTDRSEGWRTIMAYNDACVADATSCTRLLYFSNPNNSYNGNAMGVPTGTLSNCQTGTIIITEPESCDADSHAVLDSSAANNAGFRTSSKTWVGTTSDWDTASNWSDNIVPRFLDDIFVPAAPTGGNFPTTSGTAAVRNVTIQTGASATMTGGTLTVYGDWDEEGTGTFTGTAGNISFVGLLPQTITQNAGSAFFNVNIGNGTGSSNVTLGSDLDINGNLTLSAGSTLNGGTRTINLAGNWDDQESGFSPGTSTVIFDGTTQTADKVVSTTAITEPFNEADGQACCSSGVLPPGWVREHSTGLGWLGGDNSGTNGEAYRWNDSADAWLFTNAVNLKAGTTYTISYDYKELFGGATDLFTVHIGTAANSGSMTTQVSTSGNFSSTSYATQADSFTVGSDGTYYIGFRGQQIAGAGYANLDNVSLTGTQNLTYYNLQVNSTGSTTLSKAAVVQNNLTNTSGGTLNLNGQAITVEGAVTNNGALQDTLNVPNSTTTNFLVIQNAAASVTKYQGIDLTPTGGVGLGNTTVIVKGNQNCTTDPTSAAVQRCFDISTGTPNAATVRFYYLVAEANGNPEIATNIYHWNSGTSSWDLMTGTVTSSSGGDPRWVQVTDVSDFSPFVLDNTGPTAVVLSQTSTTAISTGGLVSIIALALLGLTVIIVWRRREPGRLE